MTGTSNMCYQTLKDKWITSNLFINRTELLYRLHNSKNYLYYMINDNFCTIFKLILSYFGMTKISIVKYYNILYVM